MCAKCKKLMADPKSLISITDTRTFLGFVDAMMPMITDIQNRIIRTGMETGQPIHPCTVAAVFGWLYYATMLNAVHDGDFTKEDFLSFDNLLFNDTEQGVAATIKAEKQSTTSVKVVSFDDLPDDIKGMVKEIIGGTRH